jgi:hypothetical protein
VSAARPAEPRRTLVFEHEGRTFTAQAAPREVAVRAEGPGATAAPPEDVWWWLEVSGDPQRYAPFRVDDAEDDAAVHARLIAYYVDLLARRAERPVGRFGSPGPRRPAADPARP